jgi:hypothetical protein
VLYNTYHSGIEHWLIDGPDYMTSHSRCDTDHFLTLAWYEGFANFVRDYVLQEWDWRTSDWASFPPGAGCAINGDGAVDSGLQGIHIEGNVQALLNNVFYGPVRLNQRTEIGQVKPADFTCPVGQRRIESAQGIVECEREVPTTCEGTRSPIVDQNGNIDQCRDLVRDLGCPDLAPGEPGDCPLIEQWRASRCPSGRAVRRPGADACVVLSPGRHTLPNGTPQPRPDGSPDLAVGRAVKGGKAWYSLPDLNEVMGWVVKAGTDGHRAREYWNGWMRPWCLTRDGVRYRYCHPNQSASFLEEVQRLDPTLN